MSLAQGAAGRRPERSALWLGLRPIKANIRELNGFRKLELARILERLPAPCFLLIAPKSCASGRCNDFPHVACLYDNEKCVVSSFHVQKRILEGGYIVGPNISRPHFFERMVVTPFSLSFGTPRASSSRRTLIYSSPGARDSGRRALREDARFNRLPARELRPDGSWKLTSWRAVRAQRSNTCSRSAFSKIRVFPRSTKLQHEDPRS